MVVQGRPCVRVDRRQLFPSLFFLTEIVYMLIF